MSREIIFRGKSEVTNEWVYGSLVKVGNKSYIVGFDEVDLDGHHLSYCSDRPIFTKQGTIGQFTGLYDKNGNEIYEGDILMCIGQREDNKGRKYIRNVLFTNGAFGIKLPEWKCVSCLCNHIVNGKINWEIVGNIFDNPELIDS